MSTALLAPLRTRPTSVQARRFTHPGTPSLPRLERVQASHTSELRLRLEPGTNVGEALIAELTKRGVSSGCGRILSGSTSHLQYHVIIKASGGDKPFIYGPAIVIDEPATLLASTLTLGRTADGLPLVHCHGGFTVGGSPLGGHFALDKTIVGHGGMTLVLSLFDGVEMVVGPDSETNYSILGPRSRQALS